MRNLIVLIGSLEIVPTGESFSRSVIFGGSIGAIVGKLLRMLQSVFDLDY